MSPCQLFVQKSNTVSIQFTFFDNGYGGYAVRGWSYPVWDEDVARQLGDPDAHLREVNKNRKLVALPPIESWDD